MLQPSCRTTGQPSYYNYKTNTNTWEQHPVAQDNARRWFIREQPTGQWVDDISPWEELADRSHITTVRIDQCATGLEDTTGDYIQKLTNITSNDETILKNLLSDSSAT
eukprot:615772-Pyramimonas_sp.AAC.1